MSLRLRVVALFGIVLFVSVLVGAISAGYEAKHNLKEELASGILGARQTVLSAYEDLPHSDHPARDLRQLISTFDGNRHVLAVLYDPQGRPVAASTTLAHSRSAPLWFERLLGAETPNVALGVPVPGFGAIELTPVASFDIDAVWREFSGVVIMLVVSAATGLILVYALIGRALRPLRALSDEFVHVGAGDYGRRIAAAGPSELTTLQQGFNSMVGQLASMTERNRSLTDQLLTLQEEERADIARDLHDEIGPHLFAVNMDAEMIVQLSAAAEDERLVRQARSIQGAVGHMQKQVRDLLSRLRPTPVTELGFRAAIEDLIRFWSARRPDIAFDLEMGEEAAPLEEAAKAVAFRVIQEGVNNAVRHARPTHIHIQVGRTEEHDLKVAVEDDGAAAEPSKGGGFGLMGMKERVLASGGELSFGPRPERGWSVVACLPLVHPVHGRTMRKVSA